MTTSAQKSHKLCKCHQVNNSIYFAGSMYVVSHLFSNLSLYRFFHFQKLSFLPYIWLYLRVHLTQNIRRKYLSLQKTWHQQFSIPRMNTISLQKQMMNIIFSQKRYISHLGPEFSYSKPPRALNILIPISTVHGFHAEISFWLVKIGWRYAKCLPLHCQFWFLTFKTSRNPATLM